MHRNSSDTDNDDPPRTPTSSSPPQKKKKKKKKQQQSNDSCMLDSKLLCRGERGVQRTPLPYTSTLCSLQLVYSPFVLCFLFSFFLLLLGSRSLTGSPPLRGNGFFVIPSPPSRSLTKKLENSHHHHRIKQRRVF
eukprot:gene13453-9263_t